MKKPTLFIGALFLVILFLALVRTYVANNIATSGVVLGNLEQRLAAIKTENAVLSEKLYTQSSLSNIALKAKELGYTTSKDSIVISSSQPVAFKK